MATRRLLSTLLALLVLLSAPAASQDRPEKPEKTSRKKEKIKPYGEVITEKARSDPGLFLVHRVEDQLFYEIKPGRFGETMLWVTQIAQTQAGHGFGGTQIPGGSRTPGRP